jgi:hypothetical protein
MYIKEFSAIAGRRPSSACIRPKSKLPRPWLQSPSIRRIPESPNGIFSFGLNEGPVVLRIENESSSLLWQLMRSCSSMRKGLQRAGLKGG